MPRSLKISIFITILGGLVILAYGMSIWNAHASGILYFQQYYDTPHTRLSPDTQGYIPQDGTNVCIPISSTDTLGTVAVKLYTTNTFAASSTPSQAFMQFDFWTDGNCTTGHSTVVSYPDWVSEDLTTKDGEYNLVHNFKPQAISLVGKGSMTILVSGYANAPKTVAGYLGASTTKPFLYIDDTGGNWEIGFSNTQIFETTLSPALNSITGGTTVIFTYDYYYGDTGDVDVAGYEVNDVTNGFQYQTDEHNIIASGQSTFTATSTLTTNHLHLWRAYLKNSSTGEKKYTSSWTSFCVVGSCLGAGDYIDPATGLPINASSTSFWDFLNVPQLLKTKVPTGYIYQYGTLLTTLSDIPATSTPIFNLPAEFASTSLPQLANIEFFSIDTIKELMPDWFISTMRGLLTAILWISFMFGILHKSEHHL